MCGHGDGHHCSGKNRGERVRKSTETTRELHVVSEESQSDSETIEKTPISIDIPNSPTEKILRHGLLPRLHVIDRISSVPSLSKTGKPVSVY